MKRQQVFKRLCLASTLIVLVAQPAWANEATISNIGSIASKPQTLKFKLRKPVAPVKQFDADLVARLKASVNSARSTPTNQRSQKSKRTSIAQSRRSPQAKQAPQSVPVPTTPANPPPNNAADVPPKRTPAPSRLNPNPNPLQFPTRPEEVRIEVTDAISLEQALELARRNNRQLQVAGLTLERSQAVLREAQAAEYPNLNVTAGLTSQGSDLFTSAESNTTNNTTTTTNNTDGTTNNTGATTNNTGATTNNTDATTNNLGSTGNNQPLVNNTTGTGTTSNPSVSNTTGTTTSNDQISSLLNQFNGGSTGGSSTALNGTVSLSYNLYTAGARTARIRAAEEQLRFDQLDYERLSEQLRLDVSNDYYNLQGADEQVRINRAAVTNAEASLRDAQALEQAGVGTRFAVLQFQVQLANANQNLTNSLSQQQISRRQLANRLSVAQSANVVAADPVEISGLWNLSVEESIIQAFQNRAELQQQLALRNVAEQNRRAALAENKPAVVLSTSYRISDTFNDDRSVGDSYSLGADVRWNLYDGGAAQARARAEEANIAIAETNFADTRNQVRFEVEQAYSNLQSNLANIQTASVALEQAREALRLARLRFQAGVGTQTDVISAENDLTEAEGNRVSAILDYNRALANLQRAISTGQPR